MEARVGLLVNSSKTKVMTSGNDKNSVKICLDGEYLEQVGSFVYLGSTAAVCSTFKRDWLSKGSTATCIFEENVCGIFHEVFNVRTRTLCDSYPRNHPLPWSFGLVQTRIASPSTSSPAFSSSAFSGDPRNLTSTLQTDTDRQTAHDGNTGFALRQPCSKENNSSDP